MVTLQNPPMPKLAPETDLDGTGARSNGWSAYAPAAVIAAAFMPILLLHGHELWARPHYQFFPLVIPGAVALIWRWCGKLGRVEPGMAALGSGMAVLAWLMLAAAVACISPGLGSLAALVALMGAAYTLGGWKLATAALPAWALLWLAIPPPKHLDVVLIVKLQNMVSGWSSRILDLLGVYHMMDGNVVDVDGRPLLVDQACSGVYSLITLLIGTLFYILWVRTSIPRAAILLVSAVVWVIFGNLVRIVLVVLLSSRFGVDAATGWKHEAIGMVTFCVLLGLVFSTDRLITFVFALGRWVSSNVSVPAARPPLSRSVKKTPSALDSLSLSRRPTTRERRSTSGSATVAAPKEVPTAEVPIAEPVTLPQESALGSPASTEGVTPTILPEASQTWVGSWWVAAAFGLLFVPQLFMPGARWKEVLLASDVYNSLFASIKADAMPKIVNGLEQIKFDELDRSKDSSWGEHSKFWLYGSPVGVAAVSLDYDFVDWHELTDCYRAQGWRMMTRQIITSPAPGVKSVEDTAHESKGETPVAESQSGGPVVAAEFFNGDGRYKYLVFGMYDRLGRPKEPIDARGLGSVLSARFQSWFRTGGSGDSDADVHCYQLQAFIDSDAMLNDAGKQAMLALLSKAREQVIILGLKHKAPTGDAR